MKTVFYSEELKKHFDTEEECLKAEEEQAKKFELEKQKKEERKARADEITEAFKEVDKAKEEERKARAKVYDLIEKFCKDYGAYHLSYSENNLKPVESLSLLDLFDPFDFLI